ncbi:acyl-ACP--UDP-N-acetylglucosamine O-acyltransferase [Endothiovibrio diazotrophicus]
MNVSIHPTAVVDPSARLGEGVTVGPFCLVEAHTTIGDGCVLDAYVHIKSHVTLGSGNHIHSHACLGGAPQHLGYRGEETTLLIGNDNEIREHATMHRGTVQGHGVTTVGSGGLFMAYSHVAHDCRIGNEVILSNAVNLAGHVEVGNCVVISGMSAVEQHLRIGDYAFLGGASGYNMDIPPYMLAHGVRGKLFGPNTIGLKRRDFSRESIQALSTAYKTLFLKGLSRQDALTRVENELGQVGEVANLLKFIRAGKHGVAPDYRKNGDGNGRKRQYEKQAANPN